MRGPSGGNTRAPRDLDMRASLNRLAVLSACVFASGIPRAHATDPRAADGGLNELAIFLASDHPRGLPEVEFHRIKNDLQRLDIAIPPAVHVHRFYYDGNKEYQGPFVVGGPTVVVANHPKTNQRVYVEAQLPSGYPSIAYDKNSITYIYPERRVQIQFLACDGQYFKVSYLPGRGIARRMHENGRAASDRAEARRASNQLSQSMRSAGQGIRNTAHGVAAATGSAIGRGAQLVGGAVSALPGVRMLQSQGEQAATKHAATKPRSSEPSAPVQEVDYERTVR